ncbi:MAG: diguanylate cyclase [Thermoleophilia bacterium]
MSLGRHTPQVPRALVTGGDDGDRARVRDALAAAGAAEAAGPDGADVVVVAGGDGARETLAAIRGEHPGLPTVIVSGDEVSVEAALAIGSLHSELRAERQRFAALRSSLQDGLSILSPAGRMLDANDRLAEITGRPVGELIGAEPPFAFWPAAERAAYGRRLRRALAGRVSGESDRVYVRPGGEERHVIVSIAPLRGPGGRVEAFVSTVKDVTARRAAEEELRRSDEAHQRVATQQAALARVAAAVAAGEAPEDVFALVAREVAALLEVEAGGVARFDADGLTATLLGAWTSVEALRLEPGTALPLTGESVTATVRRTGRPARIDDYAGLPAGAVGGGHAPRRSSVAAPVRIGGRVWGTVGALSDRPAGLAADAEERLAEFAGLVALGIAGAEARMQLTSLAETDALTGLANRRAFDERFPAALAEAQAPGRPLSLILMDIDHFKRVNDTFGHEAGDLVIRELAVRLAGVSRAGDLVARVGGEEFAWVVADLGAEATARTAAARLMAAVRSRPFPVAGAVTISAGIAEARDGDDGAALRRRADEALYAAKRAGRDRVVVEPEEPRSGPLVVVDEDRAAVAGDPHP